MSSTVTGVKSSGGGYRYVLECVECSNLVANQEAAFTAQYGGVLLISSGNNSISVSSLIVDTVSIGTFMVFYNTTSSSIGCTAQIPFGTSINMTLSAGAGSSRYALYKYVRYEEL